MEFFILRKKIAASVGYVNDFIATVPVSFDDAVSEFCVLLRCNGKFVMLLPA
jgi:hypothetical protein